ncbi:hypothetical protein N7447_000331 [Penicillium robsamsonii]|uniref:uncharacterized protein n=1 Tax=Penicillium robsamsonii TaxID=1792511 RepID=UPI002546ECB7|nr:uncharacterized protein N7447_000331 [Penicillium robsamsonii]KAJ5834305.1 hypothetical protein N7447_000331 [Penicillium robsamsonii]
MASYAIKKKGESSRAWTGEQLSSYRGKARYSSLEIWRDKGTGRAIDRVTWLNAGILRHVSFNFIVERKGTFGVHECMVKYEHKRKVSGSIVALQNAYSPEWKYPAGLTLEGAIVLLLKDFVKDLLPIRAWQIRIFFHESHNLT